MPATAPDRYSVAEMRALLENSVAVGAWLGGHLVALTVSRREADIVDTLFTVTDALHRGCGFATAVKAQSVLELARGGCSVFRTGGAQVNDASLRANRRLGYTMEPLWLTFGNRHAGWSVTREETA